MVTKQRAGIILGVKRTVHHHAIRPCEDNHTGTPTSASVRMAAAMCCNAFVQVPSVQHQRAAKAPFHVLD